MYDGRIPHINKVHRSVGVLLDVDRGFTEGDGGLADCEISEGVLRAPILDRILEI